MADPMLSKRKFILSKTDLALADESSFVMKSSSLNKWITGCALRFRRKFSAFSWYKIRSIAPWQWGKSALLRRREKCHKIYFRFEKGLTVPT